MNPTPIPIESARPVLVWDAPVRVFHWLLVLSFAGAYITSEGDGWRWVHVTLGYTVAGLVVFRLLWGLIGTRHARFASFVRGPRVVMRYVKDLVEGRPERHLGHNPAGAVAIVALLALALLSAASGWAIYNKLGPKLLKGLHELSGNAMLLIVIAHVLGVALASWQHHENLVRAMWTGRKPGRPGEAIRRAWRPLAALLLLAVLGFWGWRWQTAPAAGAGQATHGEAADEDDD